MPSLHNRTLSTVRPDPAPARPAPAFDQVDVAGLDDEVRRLVDHAEGLKLLEGLARRQVDDPDLWRRLASACFDVGDRRGSVRALRRAKELAPGCPEIDTDLRAVGSHVVPDWHFAMLGDAARNRAYRTAIERAVGPSSTVLELGAGSGLLSMFAARAGAARVTACEVSGVLADTATEIVRRNHLDHQITVVDRHSSDVEVGRDLPQRANVLVSELLDPALLAEGVLPSIRDARRRLLAPDAVVLPAKATVWAALLEVPGRANSAPICSIEGLDLSPMEVLRDPRQPIVTRLAGESVRFLSAPFKALDIDLSDPGPLPRTVTDQSHVPVTDDGTIHGIGWWFELWLDDQISLSTGPDQNLHWPQVLQLLPSHVTGVRGGSVPVGAGHDDHGVHFQL